MDCAWITRDDVFERYLRDELGPEERDAFEDHYFACAECADKIRTYRAMRAEFSAGPGPVPAVPERRAWAWRWAFVPAAALLVIAAAAMWLRPVPSGGRQSAAPAATEARRPETPAVARPVPGAVQGGAALGQPSTLLPAVSLEVLARLEPPVYSPAALRAPSGDAAERFRAGMARYVEGNYAAAIPDLRAATTLGPRVAQYAFFLAICELLSGQVDSAVTGLRQTVALGDSPYVEEAHFYLAKAHLRRGDIPAARLELQRTIERRGRLEESARSILVQLDALARAKDRPPGT